MKYLSPQVAAYLPISFLLLFAPVTSAQTANTVIIAGYDLPTVAKVAPGQVTNLFVEGIGSKLTARVAATGLPLPTVLAGISVTLTQSVAFGGDGPQTEAVPILAVNPVSTCSDSDPFGSSSCGSYTEVTVQIPGDFRPGGVGPSNSGWLVVSENGMPGGAFEVSPFLDNIHVMVVTHADGTPVTLNSPAKGGEALVMWLAGLGQTSPLVPSGQATPAPAPTVAPAFQLYFEYRPNSPAYRPYCPASQTCPVVQPQFSGLTAGYAGLYQVNFVVPAPPPGTPPCNDGTPHNIGSPSSVYSNLTVSIFRASLDGAEICVDPTTGSEKAAGRDPLLPSSRPPRN